MDYPVLAIDLDGCWLRFHRSSSTGPTSAGASYPLLAEIGTLRSNARAAHLPGIGSGEIPNLSVTINNQKRRASDLIGMPLRRRARIEQGDEILFDGVISDVGYGNVLKLDISA